jgi:hypothetical protein
LKFLLSKQNDKLVGGGDKVEIRAQALAYLRNTLKRELWVENKLQLAKEAR